MNASPPPGWYPDSNGATRYWDGSVWTTHTSTQPTPAVAYQEPVAAYAPAQTNQTIVRYAPPTQQSAQVQQYQPTHYTHPQVSYVAATHVRYAAPRTGEPNGAATAGFVLGLVSFLLLPILLIPFLGWFIYASLSVTGIVLSIVGIVRAGSTGTGLGLGIAGLILSVL